MGRVRHIYQQWIQGNDSYIVRYMEFVRIIARMNNESEEETLKMLEKTDWFEKLR